MAGALTRSGTSTVVSVPRPETPSPLNRTTNERTSTALPSRVPALREGDMLPTGNTYVEQSPQPRKIFTAPTDLVDLCTPPSDADTDKRKAAEKRNVTRTMNKQAHAAFVREMKDSLAGGRPPSLNVPESASHLKARWHSAAKDVAYKYLDLRKESWKEYSNFDLGRVHREINQQYKFDPPLEPRRINKYLAGHLRSSRAVWKAHWQQHGDDNRHHNCPEEAWESLIKWWPTQACKDVAADMAHRRKSVHNRSKTGRKPLVERMDDEVSHLHPICGPS